MSEPQKPYKFEAEKIKTGWLIKVWPYVSYYNQYHVTTDYELSTFIANAMSKGVDS